MAERTPAMSPEAIMRRKRSGLPLTPVQTLREKVGALGQADATLEKLLEDLVYLAERETIFTMTLEKDRLLGALDYAGYVVTAFINVENQLAPGATVTTYLPVLANFVYLVYATHHYNSLPWWLSLNVWADTDLPALPYMSMLRAPDQYSFIIPNISPIFRFIRFTATNNHAVNTLNYLTINQFYIMTRTTWEMLVEIYMKPIVEFAQETAEKRTGRPFP